MYKHCKICNKKLIGVHHATLYCSECKGQLDRKRGNDWVKQKRIKIRELKSHSTQVE